MPLLPSECRIIILGPAFQQNIESIDFGTKGVIERFSQIDPKVLFIFDKYYYNGKEIEVLSRSEEILNNIPSIQDLVIIAYPGTEISMKKINTKYIKITKFTNIIDNNIDDEKMNFELFDFNHPLAILYSSGTTGKPKCICHSTGGVLLQHMKEHMLHCDIKTNDKVFYFTTCGWMMWNWLVSGLASGAKIVIYDGSPAYPDLGSLWKMAAKVEVTHFGTSPKFLAASAKEHIIPREVANLSSLRALLSTGSPLVPEQFDWIYSNINDDFQIASISGGTDIIGCFLGGSPLLPVRRGELQCAQLGMDVQSWDAEGNSVIGESGELICAKPFPSMPIGFWNDSDGSKYHSAYFEDFPGVWTHGDFVEMTESGGAIIHGRSDTTLNPGGVRIGTAEIYRAVENLPEVVDAIAVGRPISADVEVVLCLKLAKDIELTTYLFCPIFTISEINLSSSPLL